MADKRKRGKDPEGKPLRVPPEREMENNIRDIETKRKQVIRTRNMVRLIYLLIFLIAALILPSLIRKISGRSPETFIVKTGTIEESFRTKAIIFRSEKLLEASIEGHCVPHYDEGEKVAANRIVATVVNTSSQDLMEEIRKLESRILQAREEASKQEDFFKGDIERIDSEIEKLARKISLSSIEGNIVQARQYEMEIENLLQKKADILNFSGDKNAFLQQLEKQKENLMERLKGNIDELKNAESGIISYTIDGYEKEFSLSYMKDIDVQALDARIKELESKERKAGAEYEKVYAKIVDDLYFYLACTASLKDVNALSPGASVSVRINEKNMNLEMQVESIKKEEDRAVVILKSSMAMSETISMRLVDIDVIPRKISGLKIPVKALMDYNNLSKTAKVACVKYSYIRHIPVKVTGMDKDYAIIENDPDRAGEYTINYNDIILTNPEKFVEGQLVY